MSARRNRRSSMAGGLDASPALLGLSLAGVLAAPTTQYATNISSNCTSLTYTGGTGAAAVGPCADDIVRLRSVRCAFLQKASYSARQTRPSRSRSTSSKSFVTSSSAPSIDAESPEDRSVTSSVRWRRPSPSVSCWVKVSGSGEPTAASSADVYCASAANPAAGVFNEAPGVFIAPPGVFNEAPGVFNEAPGVFGLAPPKTVGTLTFPGVLYVSFVAAGTISFAGGTFSAPPVMSGEVDTADTTDSKVRPVSAAAAARHAMN